MHSGYEVPGIQQPEPEISPDYGPPGSLPPMPQTHILDQRHLLILDQPNHFFPTTTHHYAGGASYFPAVNFKLGLNNRNNYNTTDKDAVVSIINGRGAEANVRHGSERFEVPDAARQPSLGMLHCWQNQQDSSIKQTPPFWEHLTILPEESNENSAMINEQHLCELEAIYKPPLVSPVNKTRPCEINEEEEEESNEKIKNNKTNKKKRKKRSIRNVMVKFFGSLVKQVIEHQESMHERFSEAMERLEEERKARDEDWRKREADRLHRESQEREREKKSVQGREAVIVSYLERITGERIVGNNNNNNNNNNNPSTNE